MLTRGHMKLLATTSTANWLQDICISTPTHSLLVATAFNDVFQKMLRVY